MLSSGYSWPTTNDVVRIKKLLLCGECVCVGVYVNMCAKC